VIKETTLVRWVRERLAELLPPSWTVTIGSRFDVGSLEVRSPAGGALTFFPEVKAAAYAGADALVSQVVRNSAGRRGAIPLLVMPYIGPAVRRACRESGINFVDQTGWAWISIDDPPVVIRTEGASRNPEPERSTSMRRLTGPGAGRVIRALLRQADPTGVRTLAQEAGVAPGTVSKLLKSLQPEGYVERDQAGRVLAVSKRALVDRWVQDYQFLRTNEVRRYLAPRGLPRLLSAAAGLDLPIVATGSVALRHYLPPERVPVTGLAQVALYVPDPDQAARALKLATAEPATTTVLLAAPYDDTLLDQARPASGQLRVVDAGQAVADLRTSPGRAPEEAEQLIELLAETDSSWG
jgi:hypothetical protein